MYPTIREYLVRQEQNQSLAQEAAFERWLDQVTLHSLPQEPLQDRIVQWFHAWRASWADEGPGLSMGTAVECRARSTSSLRST